MSADPNKKSVRTFQCRDSLWETFEQMAQELECSVDYLICEAMKQYARGRLSTPQPALEAPPSRPQAPAPQPQAALPPLPPSPAAHGRVSALPPLPPPPPRRAPAAAVHHAGPPPLPPPPGRVSRPMPPPVAPAAPVAHAVPRLSVIYAGEKFPITKNQFVIGRGKQSSDLTIRDPNISRQHAMVELVNGQYHMVDLGSTNGVEYNGQRIARKPIAEGDVFYICNHELVFTYR